MKWMITNTALMLKTQEHFVLSLASLQKTLIVIAFFWTC